MYTDYEKEWIREIANEKIRNYGDFALYESQQRELDQHQKTEVLPYAVTTTLANGEDQHYAIVLNPEEFLARLFKFQALVYQLAKLGLLEITTDGRRHPIYGHPGWEKSPFYNNNTYRQLFYAFDSKLKSQSNYLIAEENKDLARETFSRMPKLSVYVSNGYRTDDQVEHDDLKQQAREARQDAARANRISIRLAWITIIAGLAGVALQWYSVASTTKVDINSFPTTTRTLPSFPQWQPL